MSSRCDSPNALSPYAMPKLSTFAMRRWSLVTASRGTPKVSAAVAACTSSLRRNASMSAGSLAKCARMRSSICE
jgi:hypothetical protein